jgi:hypothetical protein
MFFQSVCQAFQAIPCIPGGATTSKVKQADDNVSGLSFEARRAYRDELGSAGLFEDPNFPPPAGHASATSLQEAATERKQANPSF